MRSTEEQYLALADGACRGNPGPMAIGGVIYPIGADPLLEISEYIGEGTNNVAEYRAVIAVMRHALIRKIERLEIHTDSQVVARQLDGGYQVRAEHLKPLWEIGNALMKRFFSIRIVNVPRAETLPADALANRALDDYELGLWVPREG